MTTLMNRLVSFLLVLFTMGGTKLAAQTGDVPMTADRWEAVFGNFEFKEHKGSPAMVMAKEGAAAVKGLTFGNGTVEFDIEPGAMGAGLGFRMRGLETLDLFYFRPQPNCATSPTCVQYAPFTHKVLLWDLFPQYQASAPLRQGEWNHVKMVISGRRMLVFVNGGMSPALAIGSLEGDLQEGQLALVGPGAFANFKVTPGAVGGLAAAAENDPAADDQHLVRSWKLSPSSPLPDGQEPAIGDLPKASAEWRPLSAERGGLVNVSRVYGNPLAPPARSVTWLKTSITSTKSQSKKVAIGWTREIWVFVNGQRVYADKNLFQPPDARKPPEGRLSLQNGSFELPLNAGENEIDVALANNFYGWGLMLRLDDLDGVRLAR